LVYKHQSEILVTEELAKYGVATGLKLASGSLFAGVYMPLTLKYFYQRWRNPALNCQLSRRNSSLAVMTLSLFLASSYQVSKSLNTLSETYFSNLSDYQLENFDGIFQEYKNVMMAPNPPVVVPQ
jgi:hypothetical protein